MFEPLTGTTIAYYNSHIKNRRKLMNKSRMKQVTFKHATNFLTIKINHSHRDFMSQKIHVIDLRSRNVSLTELFS